MELKYCWSRWQLKGPIHMTENGKYTLCGCYMSDKWTIGSGEGAKHCKVCQISKDSYDKSLRLNLGTEK